eukprot:2986269-Pyramimonas_sp.AAC.1
MYSSPPKRMPVGNTRATTRPHVRTSSAPVYNVLKSGLALHPPSTIYCSLATSGSDALRRAAARLRRTGLFQIMARPPHPGFDILYSASLYNNNPHARQVHAAARELLLVHPLSALDVGT